MTEANTNDRRFWMVIGEYQDVTKVCRDESGGAMFYDDKDAHRLAVAVCEAGVGVYVVEAVSRYSVPDPRVIKQNLHIPPMTYREDKQNGNE